VLLLACEKKEGEGGSYQGILHILRGGGRLCGDIALIGILHIFSDSTHFSIVLFLTVAGEKLRRLLGTKTANRVNIVFLLSQVESHDSKSMLTCHYILYEYNTASLI